MKMRNSPLGFVIASGVLALSLYCTSNGDSLRVEQKQRQSLERYVLPSTQPISETQPAIYSDYITPSK